MAVPTSWNLAGEDGVSARACDREDAVLERLPEGPKDGTWELGKLVEQHAAVRQRAQMSLERKPWREPGSAAH